MASLAGGNSLGTSTDVNIHSVRIYGCQRSARASNLLAGLDWVVANAKLPAVVLLAVVGPPSKGVEVAMRKLKARGVVVVAAAGNQGRDACGYTPNDVDTVNDGSAGERTGGGAVLVGVHLRESHGVTYEPRGQPKK